MLQVRDLSCNWKHDVCHVCGGCVRVCGVWGGCVQLCGVGCVCEYVGDVL